MNTELLNQTIKTLESVRGALGSFAKAEVDLTLGLLRREADEFRCPLCYDDPANIKQPAQQQYTYASTQATMCAGCGEHKHTPLRIDAMGGYVCLTCIDQKLGSLLGEFGYPQPAQQQEPPIGWTRKVFQYDREFRESAPRPLSTEWQPVYTSPPASKPLTDEEIEEIWRRVEATDFHDCVQPFARAIEAKLKERNT